MIDFFAAGDIRKNTPEIDFFSAGKGLSVPEKEEVKTGAAISVLTGESVEVPMALDTTANFPPGQKFVESKMLPTEEFKEKQENIREYREQLLPEGDTETREIPVISTITGKQISKKLPMPEEFDPIKHVEGGGLSQPALDPTELVIDVAVGGLTIPARAGVRAILKNIGREVVTGAGVTTGMGVAEVFDGSLGHQITAGMLTGAQANKIFTKGKKAIVTALRKSGVDNADKVADDIITKYKTGFPKTQAGKTFKEAIEAEKKIDFLSKGKPEIVTGVEQKALEDVPTRMNSAVNSIEPEFIKVKPQNERIGAVIDHAVKQKLTTAKLAAEKGNTELSEKLAEEAFENAEKLRMADGETTEELLSKLYPKQSSSDVSLYAGIPVHKLGEAKRNVEKVYDNAIGKPIWNFFADRLPKLAGSKSKIVDSINKGVILDYKKDPDFVALRDKTEIKIAQYRQKAKEIAGAMAEFSKPEQKRIAQIVRGSITATPQRYARAFEAIDNFQRLEKDLKKLGILGEDTFLRKFTRKELDKELQGVRKIGDEIEVLRQKIKPSTKVLKQKTTRIIKEITEDIVKKSEETITGQTAKSTDTKWVVLNEERVANALRDRGFSEGESTQMVQRIKDSVILPDKAEAVTKKIAIETKKKITKTLQTEIVKTRKYSQLLLARGRTSIKRDIKQLEEEQAKRLKRIQQHYKTSGKLYLRRAFKKYEEEQLDRRVLFGLIKRPRLKLGYNIQRQDLTKEARQALGEIEEAPFLVMKGISEEAHDVEMMRLFNNVAKNSSWSISPEGYVKAMKGELGEDLAKRYAEFKPLPESKRLGELSGKFVDPYIWDDLDQAVKELSNFTKVWDEALRLWKTGKVVYNPATHVRNMLSNVVLADFSGLAPHRVDIYSRSAKEFLEKGPLWKEANETGLLGQEWAATEIKQFLKDASELEDGSMLTAIKKLADAPGKAYQGIEQYFKLSVFMNERRLGKSTEEAAKHAEKFLFNYQKIPPAIRWAKRWYSPFVTFSYKALPRFAETSVRKPWKIAKYFMGMKAVEEVTRRMYGESQEEIDREKKVLPSYMRKSLLPGQLSHLRVPLKDEHGRSKYLDLSYIMPWGDVAEQWAQSRIGFRPLMPNNPVVSTLADIAYNEVGFTGQELTTEGVDDTTGYWGKVAKHVWAQAAPPLLGSYSSNKLMTAYRGDKDWAGRDRSLPEALFDVFLGLKLRSIDYDEQYSWRIKDHRKQISDIEKDFKKKYKKALQKNISDEKRGKIIEKIYADMDKKTNRIIDKITELSE